MNSGNLSYSIRFGSSGGENSRGLTGEDVAVERQLTPERRAWCERTLAGFDFVKWDRFIRTIGPGPTHAVICYGWIDREQDAYKDMVVIALVLETMKVVYMASSSDKYSKRICQLCGIDPALHKNCVRIEDRFGIPNAIHLKKPAGGTDAKK
ncbi:Uncharacterised protein [uncultured archaeon]|nr:Uncharacterised protein [uncultured archaeon]